jgi:hypothetical protein
MSNLNIESQRSTSSPAPPSYQSSTGGAAPPPGPPPAPTKPVIAHARALYRYNGSDSRDLSFERDDKVQVHEYMNADWWMGRNTRTGAEGIFPKTYVAVEVRLPSELFITPLGCAGSHSYSHTTWHDSRRLPTALKTAVEQRN